jgi:transposase-like protein
LKAHNNKQPKTIYTDQDSVMWKAVKEVFVEAWYGLCTFHIMQNAYKHLSGSNNEESSTFPNHIEEKNKKNQVLYLILVHACMGTKMRPHLNMHLTSRGQR